MEQQLLSLFESVKKSADAVTTSASICPEVHRCLDALDQLKRVPVTSRVLLSTPVAKGLHFLTKHRVKLIRTAASCLIDTWRRKMYARNPAVNGPTKSVNGSRTGTLVIKLRGRLIGRIRVQMPMKTLKTEENKIKEEKEKGFSSFKKQPQEPAMRFTEPENGKSIRRCFKKPPQESVKCNTTQEKARDSCGSFKKPCTRRITPQKNVKDFCSFRKQSYQGPVKCSDAFRGKVRDILVDPLSRVVREAGAGLWKAVNSCNPVRVAAEVESVMPEKMGYCST